MAAILPSEALSRALGLGLLLGLGACGGTPPSVVPDAGTPLIPADGQLPCDIANLVVTRCVACHSDPVAGSAPMPLVRRSDFAAVSTLDDKLSFAQRSLLRMKAATAPMPPTGFEPVSAAELAAFEAWVNGGLTAGTCATPAVQTTCASGVTWKKGLDGSESMMPGYACRSCHAGANLLGQNPTGASERGELFAFSGTLFPGFHEANGCNAAPAMGATVEIIDSAGVVAATLPVNAVGNFHSSTKLTVSMPYTARVKVGTKTREMVTPQTNGDCNSCHTEGGLNGAPGRIVTP